MLFKVMRNLGVDGEDYNKIHHREREQGPVADFVRTGNEVNCLLSDWLCRWQETTTRTG